MPRAYMDRTGFKVAKQGFDARTARNEDLQFSSEFASMAVWKSGTLALTSLNWDVYLGNGQFYYANIDFGGRVFAKPPLIWACGIGDDYRDIGTYVSIAQSGGKEGNFTYNYRVLILPHYIVTSWVNKGRLLVRSSASNIPWKYFIMENTIG